MQKKSWILFSLVAILLAASLFVLGSSSATKPETATCCKGLNQCPAKGKTTSQDGLILENLSRQFISITGATY